MTDSQRVYIKVLKTLKKLMPTHKQGHVVTLAMMINGIVLSGKAQLSAMSLEVPHPAKPKSLEKRMRRWVKNENVDKNFYYLPYARTLLQHLSNHPLTLVLDGSTVGRGCMTIMVCVVYRQRALPLAWLVYKGKKGHTTAKRHIEVLEKVVPLIPDGARVVLLGDAEYDTTAMQQWLQANTTWQYVLRTSPQIYVTTDTGRYAIRDLPLIQKQVVYYHQVGFTQSDAVRVNVVAWWGAEYDQPIYLVSNIDRKYLICAYYRQRFKIETFFSDQKSRGFNLHKSHLADPQRVARLLLAACLAYIWLIYLGVKVRSDQLLMRQIHRTDRCDLSLFQLGLRFLDHLLNRELPLPFQLSVPQRLNCVR